VIFLRRLGFLRRLSFLRRTLLALATALLLGGVMILASGQNPIIAYQALFRGAFGDANAIARTLINATPLLLTGSAVSVALAAGRFNIGAEGQLAVGALAAAWVAAHTQNFIAVPLGLLSGMAFGALWAFLPAWLREKRGTHEVITAILLNYVARNLTHYLAAFPLKDPDPSKQAPQTAEIAASLPRLIAGFDVHAGLVIGVSCVIGVAFVLKKTLWGYETRVVGANSEAAAASGIAPETVALRAFLLSGALAGLAGAVVVLGVVPFRRFPADFYGNGYGFDGLAVALIAGQNPLALFPAALLFGALGAGADQMSFETETPKQLAQIVQAILILALAMRFIPKKRKK
jgi:general nucleoside transport system permease protein